MSDDGSAASASLLWTLRFVPLPSAHGFGILDSPTQVDEMSRLAGEVSLLCLASSTGAYDSGAVHHSCARSNGSRQSWRLPHEASHSSGRHRRDSVLLHFNGNLCCHVVAALLSHSARAGFCEEKVLDPNKRLCLGNPGDRSSSHFRGCDKRPIRSD